MTLKRGWQPSLFDLVFVTWAIVQPFAFHRQLINSDGDLARHIRVGEIILERHSLFREDLFSYPMAGEPWVAFEWLSEVIYALVHYAGGLAGVAIFAGLTIALTYALMVRFLLSRGVDPLFAYLVTMTAAVGGAAHWLARPHLFTLLAIVLLLYLLEPTKRPRLWLYAMLFAVWANLHGGYLYGFIMIGLYLAGDLVEMQLAESRTVWVERAKHHAAALLVSVLATLVTPHGFALFGHLVGSLGQRYVVDNTSEYLSPDFHTVYSQMFLCVLLLIIGGLAISRERPTFPRLFLMLANIAFALYARRNISLLSLTVLPIIALHLDGQWRRLPEFAMRQVFARDEPRTSKGRWASLTTVIMLALALMHGNLAGLQLIPDRFDERDFPVVAVERARAAGLQGRMFNEFIWGGYLIYAWPEQRVFIDGGFYGEKMTRAYAQILFRGPGWREAMRKWDISLALIPSGSALAFDLVQEPGWSIWHCDETAVVLSRNDGTTERRNESRLLMERRSDVPAFLRSVDSADSTCVKLRRQEG